jgi:hypothetical protein
MPDDLWDAVLADPRAAGRPWLPIQQCRLLEIPRHVLRVECLRCMRIVEIQKADAVRFYGPHAIWKDAGSDCSTRPAPFAQGGTRKMGAGRIRHN